VRKTPQLRDDGAGICPTWCRRDHRPGGHADDMLHQSRPAFVAVVHGEVGFGPPRDTDRDADRDADRDTDRDARADAVVLRLVQRARSSTVWLEASSEEGRSLHLLISAESAGRLAAAMAALVQVL
jgi:hypothetical protein